jgi:hypothetical protein
VWTYVSLLGVLLIYEFLLQKITFDGPKNVFKTTSDERKMLSNDFH